MLLGGSNGLEKHIKNDIPKIKTDFTSASSHSRKQKANRHKKEIIEADLHIRYHHLLNFSTNLSYRSSNSSFAFIMQR